MRRVAPGIFVTGQELTQRRNEAEAQPNRAKRMECVELAPAFPLVGLFDSASKLDALHTLRDFYGPQNLPGLPRNLPFALR